MVSGSAGHMWKSSSRHDSTKAHQPSIAASRQAAHGPAPPPPPPARPRRPDQGPCRRIGPRSRRHRLREDAGIDIAAAEDQAHPALRACRACPRGSRPATRRRRAPPRSSKRLKAKRMAAEDLGRRHHGGALQPRAAALIAKVSSPGALESSESQSRAPLPSALATRCRRRAATGRSRPTPRARPPRASPAAPAPSPRARNPPPARRRRC
jgi:hypothetical protein